MLGPTLALKALVVNDIAQSRDALCALVRDIGHAALPASGAEEALRAMRDNPPDIVLLDLLMPGVNGFDLLPRLRELAADRWVPVVAMSSLQGDAHVIEALTCGADDFLSRPVNRALLQAKLVHYGRVLALQARLGAVAQRLRDIHDHIAEPVITVDDGGCIVEANPAAIRAFACGDEAALRGARVNAVLGVEADALCSAAATILTLADGRTMQAEVSASRWIEAGRACVTAVIRDLTERQSNERMRDEFLATVSHELRTPLTSVLGAVGLLAAGAAGPMPAAALPLAEVAHRNGARLSKLIDDILDLTKLEGDRMELHLRPQPLAPLVEEAIAAGRAYAEQAGVQLASVGEDVPDTPPAEVRMDADRFLQVMANLLSNAIKHSPRGETVTVTLVHGVRSHRVVVADRGPGVSPEFQARLFEKFSQAESGDRRVHGGTGLGLYITRLLVDRLGGRVRLEPGPGAVFSVEFPTANHALPVERLCLLHVEVDPDMRQRVASWLAPLGDVRSFGSLGTVPQGLQGRGVVIANPLGQGPADAFCAALLRLADGRPVLMFSDSVDAAFAGAHGFRWLSPGRVDASRLQGEVRAILGNIGPRAAAGGAS